ncbi:aminotransferase class I/II-fold pyridoxal phosphate-dependent enzyme [Pedobacter nutrimenti]|jgi:glycine C-acetyltransferase|uniref:Glycine C-acetyltransferase n=1 Tax=Pedobacter nutrimenti TaxID=1241337 RepID=A0A318UL62_9SPHI|nr:aminotransferase class I/II-fold pyridoxal phosphate-dependent enzyme [Pedobacter nutrimenti]PYF77186.1 glycine C-acetyltransferase [Pedobacter nutrimenti]
MKINFDNASFKDFENIPGLDPYQWAELFNDYSEQLREKGHMNYRFESLSGCGPEIELKVPGKFDQRYVSLVSNDYLGFTQHPKMKAAAIRGIERFGSGAGASPAIGGHFSFHQELEQKIAGFFQRESAIIYTTGYTANSATFQCLLKKEDLAILDMSVHASVYEGCQLTNVKSFPHNNMEALERILQSSKDRYRTRMVIIDGVYSQDGDLAPLDKIVELCRHYDAYLAMDDAHGTGVIGKTGRGVIELYDLYQQVDIITGTFSKALGHIGGYVVASPKLINFLKFQARQHLFSSTSTPASMCILQAIDLIDEEPHWMEKLRENTAYLKNGLLSLGLDIGTSASAIIPVKIGDITRNAEICRLLMDAGVYTNQINYPAVSRKDARIRMSLMATHTQEQLDTVLNAWEWVKAKAGLHAEA